VLDSSTRNELSRGYQRPNLAKIKKDLILSFPCLVDAIRNKYVSR